MSRKLRIQCACGIIILVLASGSFTSQLFGQNRFFVDDQSVSIEDSTVRVPVLMDTTQNRHALSISVVYDRTRLQFTSLDIVGAVTETADWSVGQSADAGSEGVIIWSFVMGLNTGAEGFDPNKVITAGNGLEMAYLNFDITASEAGAAFVRFEDVNPALPARNRMVFEATGTSPILGQGTITIVPLPEFIRGDANEDTILDIVDAMFSLFVQFGGLSAPACEDRLDVDDNGIVAINEPVLILENLFLSGPPPMPPFPTAGTDPSSDGLTCD